MNTATGWIISYFKCRCQSRFRYFDSERKHTAKCSLCEERIKTRSFRIVNDYDDDIKCFGYFNCYRCRNQWSSAHTWINYYQKCLRCKRKNFPLELREFKSQSYGGNIDDDKARFHRRDCCRKCQEDGDCRYSSYDDDYYYNSWYFTYY